MGLFNSLKEYTSDSLLPAPCYREELRGFAKANLLRAYISESASQLSTQQYSKQCAIAARELLDRLYMTDCCSDVLARIFREAVGMIHFSVYHQVYSQDQRGWLEDVAKRWSDEEALVEEFSFLRSRGAWIPYPTDLSHLDYGAIEVGLKRWIAMQDDGVRQIRDESKFDVCNNSGEEQGVFKVKMQ
jgi:hypothetical protein